MKLHKKFRPFAVGTRVWYSGPTSYGDVADQESGTVIALGNSITIELDRYKHPYTSKSDGCYIIPQRRYANISIGDIITGHKRIDHIL